VVKKAGGGTDLKGHGKRIGISRMNWGNNKREKITWKKESVKGKGETRDQE